MRREEKVACVKLHMEAGSIVAMYGDGENDVPGIHHSMCLSTVPTTRPEAMPPRVLSAVIVWPYCSRMAS
jgi:hypothetical protein